MCQTRGRKNWQKNKTKNKVTFACFKSGIFLKDLILLILLKFQNLLYRIQRKCLSTSLKDFFKMGHHNHFNSMFSQYRTDVLI